MRWSKSWGLLGPHGHHGHQGGDKASKRWPDAFESLSIEGEAPQSVHQTGKTFPNSCDVDFYYCYVVFVPLCFVSCSDVYSFLFCWNVHVHCLSFTYDWERYFKLKGADQNKRSHAVLVKFWTMNLLALCLSVATPWISNLLNLNIAVDPVKEISDGS